jgi:hypothetical protein
MGQSYLPSQAIGYASGKSVAPVIEKEILARLRSFFPSNE